MQRIFERNVGTIRIAKVIGATLAGLLLQGCDMCSTGDLRCSGNVVEECNSNRNWESYHDCGTSQCGVGRAVCGEPLIPLPGGEVWCCR